MQRQHLSKFFARVFWQFVGEVSNRHYIDAIVEVRFTRRERFSIPTNHRISDAGCLVRDRYTAFYIAADIGNHRWYEARNLRI